MSHHLTPVEEAQAHGAVTALTDLRIEVVEARTQTEQKVRNSDIPESAMDAIMRPFEYFIKAIDRRIDAIEDVLRE